MSNYHIFRFYIRLDKTEVVWTDEGYLNFSTDDDTISGSNSIGVGYDNLDDPQLVKGQEIECSHGNLTGYPFIPPKIRLNYAEKYEMP